MSPCRPFSPSCITGVWAQAPPALCCFFSPGPLSELKWITRGKRPKPASWPPPPASGCCSYSDPREVGGSGERLWSQTTLFKSQLLHLWDFYLISHASVSPSTRQGSSQPLPHRVVLGFSGIEARTSLCVWKMGAKHISTSVMSLLRQRFSRAARLSVRGRVTLCCGLGGVGLSCTSQELRQRASLTSTPWMPVAASLPLS